MPMVYPIGMNTTPKAPKTKTLFNDLGVIGIGAEIEFYHRTKYSSQVTIGTGIVCDLTNGIDVSKNGQYYGRTDIYSVCKVISRGTIA